MTFYKSRIYAGVYVFTDLLILPHNSLFYSLYYLRLMSALMSKIIFLDVPTHLLQSVYYTVISSSSTFLSLAKQRLCTDYSHMENRNAQTNSSRRTLRPCQRLHHPLIHPSKNAAIRHDISVPSILSSFLGFMFPFFFIFFTSFLYKISLRNSSHPYES